MLKVGITGGIGAGKSIVCEILHKWGIPVFMADQYGRRLLENNVSVHLKLKKEFGSHIFINNTPDRKAISDLVFYNKKNLYKLNNIIHPLVRSGFLEWCEKQSAQYVIEEAAILYESGSDKLMDKIIMVYCEKELRIERIIKRNGFNRNHIERIIQNQMSDEEKKEKADYVIYNNGKTLLLPQIIDIHNKLTISHNG